LVGVQQPVVFRGTTQSSSGDLAPAQRPIWAGTTGPVGACPDRTPCSVRRTSSLDILWSDGPSGQLTLRGTGRDLITGASIDETEIAAEAKLDVMLKLPARTITSAVLDSDPHGVAEWLTEHGGHFRTRAELDRERGAFVAGGSVGALLVDEIPAATLISGSSLVRSGLVRREPGESGVARGVCAGWIEGGSMHVALSTRPFMGEGPPAPALTRADDPLAWHVEPTLPVNAMRRRRRIDVRAGANNDEPIDVDVFFRDSIVEDIDDSGDERGLETVIHEYGIEVRVDRSTRRVASIAATAHVLPGPECPSAVASAQRLVGMSIDEIRAHVRDEFRGTTTCTHLNDALRSIGDLSALLSMLP
jgi:hypothetical protein